MRIRNYLLASSVALLAACGGDNNKISTGELTEQWAQAELFYSFPYHQQENVSLNAPLVLRFSDPIAGTLSPSNVQLLCESGPCKENTTGQQGDVVQWRTGKPDIVDGNRGLILYTAHELMANSKYCVEFEGLQLTHGGANTPKSGFCFNTRVAPDKRGSLAEYGALTDKLEIVRTFPALDGANTEPVMDFSTFRVRFNQPIKDTQVHYGDNVVLKQGDEAVDATLLVKRNLMTIAPKQTLTAGQEYTLTIKDLQGLYNDAPLSETVVYTFTPQDSQPRTILVQDTVEARPLNEGKAPEGLTNHCEIKEGIEDPIKSVLTGQAINCVPMESVLLGNKDSTMQYGDVFAELAFLPNFVDVSPLRVPRGSLLTGTNIDVRVAGVINPNGDNEFTEEEAATTAGIMKTGKVSVSFISDATGYIYNNPYSTDPTAPKQVKLFMDLAMTAEGMSPNASLSQDLLHVELNGMANLDEKSMVIDAVGIVEPDVLGTEVAFGFLSFQMKSYPQSEMAEAFSAQVNALTIWEQELGPEQQSVYPPEGETMLPTDAVTVHFNAPLDPSTIKFNDTLFLSSAEDNQLAATDIEWYLDGASLVVKKPSGFMAGASYQLELTDGITGLPFPEIEAVSEDASLRRFFLEQGKGKSIVPVTHQFTLALFDDGEVDSNKFAYAGTINDGKHEPKPFHYPAILTAYPGYPCAVEWIVGVGTEKVGYCKGDVAEGQSEVIIRPQHVPSNRPLRLTFSKPVIVGEGAFEVFEDGSNEKVKGALLAKGFEVSFIPLEPWKPGVLYKYVVKTAESGDCSKIVCGTNGRPLMTAPLAVQVPAEAPIIETGAFVTSEMFFYGAHKTKTVLQSLRNTPTLDTAAIMTYYKEMNEEAQAVIAEQGDDAEFPNSTQLLFDKTESEFFSKIITDARIGCLEKNGPCKDKSFIHLAGNLDTEIFGAVTWQCLYKNEDGTDKSYCKEATDIDIQAAGGKTPVFDSEGQAVAVGIYPTAILAGSADVFAKVGLTGNSFFDKLLELLVDGIAGTKEGWLPSPTGMQVMRMHPVEALIAPEEGNSMAQHPLYKTNPNGLIPGWIRNTSAGPVFETRVRLYLDAPYLSVLNGTGSHNQRNYELNLDLRGPVEFLGDGRIQIHQRNLNEEAVRVELGDLTLNTEGRIHLKIPQGGAYMVYQGEPVKK